MRIFLLLRTWNTNTDMLGTMGRHAMSTIQRHLENNLSRPPETINQYRLFEFTNILKAKLRAVVFYLFFQQALISVKYLPTWWHSLCIRISLTKSLHRFALTRASQRNSWPPTIWCICTESLYFKMVPFASLLRAAQSRSSEIRPQDLNYSCLFLRKEKTRP